MRAKNEDLQSVRVNLEDDRISIWTSGSNTDYRTGTNFANSSFHTVRIAYEGNDSYLRLSRWPTTQPWPHNCLGIRERKRKFQRGRWMVYWRIHRRSGRWLGRWLHPVHEQQGIFVGPGTDIVCTIRWRDSLARFVGAIAAAGLKRRRH